MDKQRTCHGAVYLNMFGPFWRQTNSKRHTSLSGLRVALHLRDASMKRNLLDVLFKGPLEQTLRQCYSHSTCTPRNWITNSIRGFFPREELSSNSISINRMTTFEPPTPRLSKERMVDSMSWQGHSFSCKSWVCLCFHCRHLTLLHKSRSSYQRQSVALPSLFLLLPFSLTEGKSLFLLSGGIPSCPCLQHSDLYLAIGIIIKNKFKQKLLRSLSCYSHYIK